MDYDRKTLLALTPEKYLSGGYRDEHGKPRPELRALFATAASTQLEAAGIRGQRGRRGVGEPAVGEARLRGRRPGAQRPISPISHADA